MRRLCIRLAAILALAVDLFGVSAYSQEPMPVAGIVESPPFTPSSATIATDTPSSGFWFSGEYLLLHPQRGGQNVGIAAPNYAGLSQGAVESLHWGDTSGVRGGVGYTLPGTDWDVGLFATYFDARNHQTLTPASGGFILDTRSHWGGYELVDSVDGTTGLNYLLIDLALGKTLRIGESVDLRLFGGARFAQIDQTLKTIYTGGTLGSNLDNVSCPDTFQGGGLTTGCEGNWKLYQNWGLYGKARLSLLVGQFRTQLQETIGQRESYPTIDESFDRVIPCSELGAGVSYHGEHFFVSAGYDFVTWFNMVNNVEYLDSVIPNHTTHRQGDLTLDALSLKLGFNF